MLGLIALVAVGCSSAAVGDDVWTDPSPHVDRFVEVNGVRLNYLDWGGSGQSVILLQGAWGNAHVFDTVAPQLAREFRTIAYSRRGQGKSEIPAEPFNLDVLVEDLRQVMDQFAIDRAHLVGWSNAGYVLTRFAVKYPERTRRLVYVDAHFEYSEAEPRVPFRLAAFDEEPWASLWDPHAEDLSSLDAYRAWFHSTVLPDLEWTPALEAWIRDFVDVMPDGSVKERRPQVVKESYAVIDEHRRQYHQVQAPALAIFAEQFLALRSDPELADAVERWNQRFGLPGQEIGRERFREGLREIEILDYAGTSHDSVLHMNPDVLGADIRAFLSANDL